MTAPIVGGLRAWGVGFSRDAAFLLCARVLVITPFLENPAVPVEVGEVCEAGVVATGWVDSRREASVPGADRRLVADLADRDPAFEQPVPCRLKVVDDQIDVANRS